MAGRLLQVARVAGAFGVRGEIRITTFTEDPLALATYRVLTREDGSPGLTITTARAVKGAVIARLDPRVVLWATDAAGRCGVRPGQAGLVAGPTGAQWYMPETTDDSVLGSAFRVLRQVETPGLAGQVGQARILRR